MHRVAELRQEMGISRTKLAGDIGFHRMTLQTLESGKTKRPSLALMAALIDYFGKDKITHGDFFDFTPAIPRQPKVWTASEIKDIVRDYNDGKSSHWLAAQYGVNQTVALRVLHENGAKIRPTGAQPQQ